MFAKLAASVSLGFLGAYPLARTTGLMATVQPHQQNSIIITSGLILGFLTLALIGPTIRLIRQVVETLGQVEDRPKPMVAGVMLLLGTACAISSLQIAMNNSSRPPLGLSMNIPGFNAGTNVVSQPSGSFLLDVLTLLTFLLGVSLVGLGIWASIKPGAKVTDAVIKPEAREFADVAS
jgi:hypothetical protein